MMELRGKQVERFIETNLRHSEGPWSGEPFVLLDYQRDVIHDIYDDRTAEGMRRVREYMLEAGKGTGKTPFVAALGIVEMLFAGPGALVMSLASTYRQAWETSFNSARNLILASPTLSQLCEVQEKLIRGPDGCRWVVMPSKAGKGGHAGYRPTCGIIEESQELQDRAAVDAIQANQVKMSKRQPLLLIVGNAGREDTIAHDWHQKAVRWQQGERSPELKNFAGRAYSLEAEADWHDESLWPKANPALGHIITMDALRDEHAKALTDPAVEYRFRTLHLGQWLGQSQTGYLDMQAWSKCRHDLPTDDELRKMPAWLSLDMSEIDDMTAIAIAWVAPDRRIYVRCWQWMPRPTAERYKETHDIDYLTWGKDNRYLNLTDTIQIDHNIKAEIAAHVEALASRYDIRGLQFDASRAVEIIQRLERHPKLVGKCEPIPQKFEHVSAATKELAARVVAGTIVIEPNPCVDWQAANLHVLTNTIGDVRYCKTAAKGKYAGKRSAKIDSITAIILCLTRAMRYANALVPERRSNAGKIIYIED